MEKYNGLLKVCAGEHLEEKGSDFSKKWIEENNELITSYENEISSNEVFKNKNLISPRQYAIAEIYFSKLSKVELEEVKEMAGKYLPQVFPEGKL